LDLSKFLAFVNVTLSILNKQYFSSIITMDRIESKLHYLLDEVEFNTILRSEAKDFLLLNKAVRQW